MGVIERARALRRQIEDNAAGMSDYMALQYVELFGVWSGDGVAYKAGDRIRYKGTLYKVLQDHISQGDWLPDSTSSLYARVLIPDPSVVPEWEQPDSTNPYSKGDKVLHGGKTWESLVDGNVWEPGAVGTESLWREVTE
ncbi:carbohydrate-binding protein [Blautia sp. JLR.GB0024]|uniref:carbohydrate-binding protein n=1 Tax=Blautia sp. JLR.GB0024 TaxID=3123295 RepID=UPI003004FC4F